VSSVFPLGDIKYAITPLKPGTEFSFSLATLSLLSCYFSPVSHFVKSLLFSVFFLGISAGCTHAQSSPFVPLEYEYPQSALSSPKTYIYKDLATGALRYKDIALERNGNDLVVHWKEYDDSPVADSCTEINDKGFDHYMLMNSTAVKAVVSEDSVYQNGTKLGEKVQTFYFNLSDQITLFTSTRSSFLKDTSITWKGIPVPCLVVQSNRLQRLTNSLFPDKPKEANGIIYFYFAKDVGLIMYRSESQQDHSVWQLQEIKDKRSN
jgi:hypothetical protein